MKTIGNAITHSNCNNVELTVEAADRSDSNPGARITVKDDGRGVVVPDIMLRIPGTAKTNLQGMKGFTQSNLMFNIRQEVKNNENLSFCNRCRNYDTGFPVM